MLIKSKNNLGGIILTLFLAMPLASCMKSIRQDNGRPEEITEIDSVDPDAEEEYFLKEDMYRFQDIPVPVGFSLVRSESFVFENLAVKAGKLIYRGPESIRDLVVFYKNEMQFHEWTLINLFEDESALLNFSKKNRDCSIRITTGAWRSKIDIRFGPTNDEDGNNF